MIQIQGLIKSFGENEVLRGVDLEIETGESLAIIGQSGCGKSVLIKHIIALLQPDSGRVLVDGQDVHSLSREELYNLRLRFGFLFQGAALFDSMTVAENIALGLIENGAISDGEIRDVVADKLEMVGLQGIEKLKPSELSGGMKKRVGLARALATNPDYILYDEPTTGLDPVMSNQIDTLIADLADKLNITSIIITHDMFSVYNIVHKIAMIHEGVIRFSGSPEEMQQTEDSVIQDFLFRYDTLEK